MKSIKTYSGFISYLIAKSHSKQSSSLEYYAEILFKKVYLTLDIWVIYMKFVPLVLMWLKTHTTINWREGRMFNFLVQLYSCVLVYLAVICSRCLYYVLPNVVRCLLISTHPLSHLRIPSVSRALLPSILLDQESGPLLIGKLSPC